MEFDELKQYVAHKFICVDIRFDESTNVLRATEITQHRQQWGKFKRVWEVRLNFFIYIREGLVDNAETQALIIGEYPSLEAILPNLEIYLGKPLENWQNHIRSGYKIALSDTLAEKIRSIDWKNWKPTENTLYVPQGATFNIRKPDDWKDKVKLINDSPT